VTLLVVNCGSSSLKCRLYEMPGETLLASGSVEPIGSSDARLHCEAGERSEVRAVAAPTHAVALELLGAALFDAAPGASSPDVVAHRVVHGGERFREAVRVDAEVERAIEALAPLAPMHNPIGLLGIRTAAALYPAAQPVAVFDTAFHQSLPEHAFLYALPYELYEREGIRRYGFHGASHRHVARRVGELLGGAGGASRIISCHLGAGCSITAIRDGRSVDTSMGMTPLEGLVMATRSGDLDPGIFAQLALRRGMTAGEVAALLNQESGLLGLSGLSGDMRELERAAANGHARAECALAVFAHRARRYIGACLAVLGGADALAFTGGAGANSASLRARILAGLDGLGMQLDAAANEGCAGTEMLISGVHSTVSLLVVPPDEELAIAREAFAAVAASAG
jgi:acetate kinase